MYRTFSVRNFRCFDALTITDLKRINLIAGKNNVGKTALLEALYVHSGAYNPELALRLNAFRGLGTFIVGSGAQPEPPWDSLIRDYDTTKAVEFEGDHDLVGHTRVELRSLTRPEELKEIESYLSNLPVTVGEPTGLLASSESVRTLRLTHVDNEKRESKYFLFFQPTGFSIAPPVLPVPAFPGILMSARGRVVPQADAGRFGALVRTKSQDILLEALRYIEPNLEALAVIPIGSIPTIHGDIGLKTLIPLQLMGDGMSNLTSLLLAITEARNGVVFIDEIENGLHHSVLREVWQSIGNAASKYNTQVFASTHSLECISAAQEAFGSDSDEFRLHRLERVNGQVRVIPYSPEVLAAALDNNLEVR